jgi:hypothetical protein
MDIARISLYVGIVVGLATIYGVWLTRRSTNVAQRADERSAAQALMLARPLLAFEIGNMIQVMGWEHAKVPLVIRNIGTHAATITSATLEFWAIPGGTLQSEERPDLVGVVEPGHPKSHDLVIPLRNIPESEQPKQLAGTKRVTFRVRFTVRGLTGEAVPGCSQEFKL